jgi:hypothetical protein
MPKPSTGIQPHLNTTKQFPILEGKDVLASAQTEQEKLPVYITYSANIITRFNCDKTYSYIVPTRCTQILANIKEYSEF